MSRYIQAAVRNLLDEDDNAKMEILNSIDTEPEVLTILANDPEDVVRSLVAAHPNTPSEVLRTLSKDPCYIVKLYVARNANTPLDCLAELGNEPILDVRRSARVEYEVEVSYCGMIGASETLTILARANATKDELQDTLITDFADDLIDMLSVESTDYIGDDEWEITINFGGYIGCDTTYNVDGYDEEDVDSAIDWAMEEATCDFSIISYTMIPR